MDKLILKTIGGRLYLSPFNFISDLESLCKEYINSDSLLNIVIQNNYFANDWEEIESEIILERVTDKYILRLFEFDETYIKGYRILIKNTINEFWLYIGIEYSIQFISNILKTSIQTLNKVIGMDTTISKFLIRENFYKYDLINYLLKSNLFITNCHKYESKRNKPERTNYTYNPDIEKGLFPVCNLYMGIDLDLIRTLKDDSVYKSNKVD